MSVYTDIYTDMFTQQSFVLFFRTVLLSDGHPYGFCTVYSVCPYLLPYPTIRYEALDVYFVLHTYPNRLPVLSKVRDIAFVLSLVDTVGTGVHARFRYASCNLCASLLQVRVLSISTSICPLCWQLPTALLTSHVLAPSLTKMRRVTHHRRTTSTAPSRWTQCSV